MLHRNILSLLCFTLSTHLLPAPSSKETQSIDSYLATHQNTAQTYTVTITKDNTQTTQTCFKIAARNSRDKNILLLIPTDASVIDVYECDTANRKFLPYLRAQLATYFCNDLTDLRATACGYNFTPNDKRTTTITTIFVP